MQISMFPNSETVRAHCHAGDPGTSREAAATVIESGLVKTHKEIIFQCLMKIQPATSFEIAYKCHLNYHAVARRLPDLERDGFVEKVKEDEELQQRDGRVLWQVKK